jgi:cytochrome c biogenesis protein CcmG/thiol:disulfide interchange protein DsbE
MRIRTATSRILALTLSVVATAGLAACGGGDDSGAGNPESEAIDYQKALANAPPALAKLYANGDEIIDGGVDELHSQLAKLRGHPVVVNVWASWCGPCRFEFPDFQAVSAERGDRVAFLGVDTDDSVEAANDFLAELPLPYPSVSDPDSDYYRGELDVVALPSTAFYDSAGELQYVKQGPYTSEEALNADIDKYAG